MLVITQLVVRNYYMQLSRVKGHNVHTLELSIISTSKRKFLKGHSVFEGEYFSYNVILSGDSR